MSDQEQFNKWIRAEVVTAFAVGSVVASAVVWFLSPINQLNTQMAVIQNQIAELKSNDLTHIELSLNSQDVRMADLQKQIFEIAKTLAAVATLINNK